MSFASVGASLWLIPLAGLIILLYLLKMRRKEMRVPATFLWPAMIYEIRANSLIQKLRFSWLMVLQLLALCLVVAALAHPQMRQKGLGGEVTVLVIDASASMQATDIKPSRFGEALRIARGLVDSVRSGDRLALVVAGPSPKVIAPLSSDPAKMRSALSNIEGTDAEANVGEALRLASSIVSKQPNARIILLSDGIFPDIQNFSPGQAQAVFQRIGTSDKNAGITAFASSGREVFCGLKNFGKDPAFGTLNILADGKLFNSFKVTLPGHGTLGKSFPAPLNASVLEAKLDAADDLPTDNDAVALSESVGTLRVLLVGKGDLFLERALSLDPRVTLFKSASVPKSGAYDIIVFDGVPEVAIHATGVLSFGAAGEGSPVRASGTASKPIFTSAETKLPLMRGVNLEGTYIESAQTVEPTSGQAIAMGTAGPLIVAANGLQKHIYVAFEPLRSDFPLQVSFPIFIANALDFLAPKEANSPVLSINAGRTVSFSALDPSVKLLVTGPDGHQTNITATNGAYILRELNRVGKYQLSGPLHKTVYVRFGSDVQSNIAPIDRINIGNSRVVTSSTLTRLADWWRPLVLLSLLVLVGEWWLFMRKS